MLLIGTGQHPYAYYQMLRLVACISGAAVAITEFGESKRVGFLTVAFAVVSVLFNPFVPLRLGRDQWEYIDGIVGLSFLAYPIMATFGLTWGLLTKQGIADSTQNDKMSKQSTHACHDPMSPSNAADVLNAAIWTDPAIGIANRRAFEKFIEGQFAASAGSGRPLSLLLIDIDGLKRINENYGRGTGDQVVFAIARLLASAARKEDLVARCFDCDEFALLMPGTGRGFAAAVATTIARAVFERPLILSNVPVAVSVSIGVATLERGSPFYAPAHLIKGADMALAAAKNDGRNCVKIFRFKPLPTDSAAEAGIFERASAGEPMG